MTDFTSLGLAPTLLQALADEGYTQPTPIQTQAIPPLLKGRDLLGIAQTGTGKTAAFALPILQKLADNPRRPAPKTCRALILSPTRELASQIAESFRAYGRHMKLSVAVVFGGVGPRPQVQALARGLDVLVATPGRLLDHMSQGYAKLGETEIFVLDEADQMLDLGFIRPIHKIVSYLPKQRQNLFFSATMPKEIAGLAADLLRDPVRVAVTPVATTAERLAQRVIHVEQAKKSALLAEILRGADVTRTLVFTRTKRGADRVARSLEIAGFGCAAIHGNKSQSQRERALDGFREGDITILVATDIAARGIDVDGVSHVVNYDLPEVPEAYVHRIGRTARAGASGQAIAFCDGGERDLLRQIERLTRQQIPSEDRRRDEKLIPEARGPKPPRDSRDPRAQQSRSRPAQRGGDDRRQERGPRATRADQDKRQDAAPRSDRAPRAPHADRRHPFENRQASNAPRRDDRRPAPAAARSSEPRRQDGPPREARHGDDRRPEHRPGDQRRTDARPNEQRANSEPRRFDAPRRDASTGHAPRPRSADQNRPRQGDQPRRPQAQQQRDDWTPAARSRHVDTSR